MDKSKTIDGLEKVYWMLLISLFHGDDSLN